MLNHEEIKDNEYEVILVNSDRNMGTPDQNQYVIIKKKSGSIPT